MRNKKNRVTESPEFDFMPIGQAIKKAREASGLTRERLAKILDTFVDKELTVIAGTANAICKAKESED